MVAILSSKMLRQQRFYLMSDKKMSFLAALYFVQLQLYHQLHFQLLLLQPVAER
jgi:hypothetical protein